MSLYVLLQSNYDVSLEMNQCEQFKALVVDVAMDQDIQTDNSNYGKFNENILQNELNYFLKYIKAETLDRLLSVKPGFEHWIIQIIEKNKDCHKGFDFLLRHFVGKFNDQQRSEIFVQILTRKSAASSYWNDMFGVYFEKYEKIPDEIHLKLILENLGESVLEKLLLHDEVGNGAIIERA